MPFWYESTADRGGLEDWASIIEGDAKAPPRRTSTHVHQKSEEHGNDADSISNHAVLARVVSPNVKDLEHVDVVVGFRGDQATPNTKETVESKEENGRDDDEGRHPSSPHDRLFGVRGPHALPKGLRVKSSCGQRHRVHKERGPAEQRRSKAGHHHRIATFVGQRLRQRFAEGRGDVDGNHEKEQQRSDSLNLIRDDTSLKTADSRVEEGKERDNDNDGPSLGSADVGSENSSHGGILGNQTDGHVEENDEHAHGLGDGSVAPAHVVADRICRWHVPEEMLAGIGKEKNLRCVQVNGRNPAIVRRRV